MRLSVPRLTTAAGVAALVAAFLIPAQPAAADPPGVLAAYAASLAMPEASPPGANDWSCVPSAAHPRPVVLIHGTAENAYANWQALSPKLKLAGYCVFAVNFGATTGNAVKGMGDIPTSAAALGAFVDQVRTSTGAAKVDLVGHSQGGGIMPRWYLKFNGGAAKVNRLVGISPSNHGTNVLGLTYVLSALQLMNPLGTFTGPALAQQAAGSDTNAILDSGGDTVAGVAYTTIVSQYDEVVTPYQNQYLSGPSVTNILLQNLCALDLVDHLGSAYDPIAIRLVLNALDPSTAVAPVCQLVLPVLS
ncbi:triacylglycerol esterase/lipase EstA (alpha/beta hydrolase family) [Allocatelliglobosispora scoriae]|uniref:Triacylglycerol esterase/lipase EstA (Alpha/beta hydrolase family) n=1 Tax=Allocatelliglobosispora scoriae TaxID=643052 RepID=A0A841BHD5_9ACTN|nr:alpha/beta fold hydrolase [Allocatelliglobosispora scoriae]MBB5868497.1 triacylglycerol esterase/lipase EstA (alpha/beta hydrolase family) [Allocatelliglobosispora scoriae]